MSSSKDPYRYFRIEARELLDEMGSALLSLEGEQAADAAVARLLRLAHTLKGAARVVRQKEIGEHAHAIEDALAPWRDTGQALPKDALSPLMQRLDQMDALLAQLGTAAPAQDAPDAQKQQPTQAASIPDAGKPSAQTGPGGGADAPRGSLLEGAPGTQARQAEDGHKGLRADPQEFTAVLEGIASSHVRVASMREHLDATQRASELADMLLGHLGRRRHRAGVSMATLEQDVAIAHDMAEELRARITQLDTALSRTTDQLDRELRQTRETAEQLKLVPVRQLFHTLARTVWDVAQLQGKLATFQGIGGDVRLDAEMLAVLQAALVQMVRNAVAHGIEAPQVRLSQGKPAQGLVKLEVTREGAHVCFTCCDDGAGIDTEAVARRAGQRGPPGGDDGPLDEATLARVLLRGGVSTAASVTEASGRGIGLNVVNEALEKLGGHIRLSTTRGKGTTWRMNVPMNMAAITVLCLEAGGQLAMLPLDAVHHTQRVPAAELIQGGEGLSLVHGDHAIPFMPLHHALGRSTAGDERDIWSTVIVRAHDARAAIGVDRLLGVAQIVMQPVPELAPASGPIAGAALDAQGRPQLVIDPPRLLKMAQGARHAPAAQTPNRLPILVIDDSLTTRMLEQSILSSAGHEVHAAISAEEGLEMARAQPYSLILVDVDMPGMDGFTFVETIRQDEALRHLPAILVTSRDTAEDFQRGRDVGADGYIVKGDFAQGVFLDTVRRLIDRRHHQT